jgi:dipeptidyl aminopeptidase/acylaminoacyl peptidase
MMYILSRDRIKRLISKCFAVVSGEKRYKIELCRMGDTIFAIGIVLVFSLISIPVQGQPTASNTLNLDSYYDYESVSSPQVSPDGSEIIFERQWIDKVNDDRESTLWIMNADGSRKQELVDGSSAQWSPDGTRLAYVAEGEPEGSQIFVKYMDVEDGRETQITRVEETPQNLKWSPDGERIAFTMHVPSEDDGSFPVDMPSKPEGGDWTEAPRFVDDLSYRYDGVGFLKEGKTHIFTVSATGGTPQQITSGDWNHGESGISWTQDGEEILFSSFREEGADQDIELMFRHSEIYAIDVSSGDIRRLTTREGPDQNPVVSPDNEKVAYVGHDWTDDTYYADELYVMNIDGSNPREIATKLDRSPDDVMWAEDNSGVYMNIENEGHENLYFAPLEGEAWPVTEGAHMLSTSDIHASSNTAVGVRTTGQKPEDVVKFNLQDPEIEQLTRVNDDILSDVQLGEVEEIWYESADGLDIQGWIIKPPNFDPTEEYPLILRIHGGPHGMYDIGFSYTLQHHAAKGYVVLYTNPRGSTGYGSEFGNEIDNAYPGKDYDDLMNGVDELIDRGYIDKDNLFVYGGSGGGVLTSWIVGQTDRFTAASVNYPVTNWISFNGTTDLVTWYYKFEEYPWIDPSEHLERSPLMYVENVTTPTMLMVGAKDLRTPVGQTEEYYQALKTRQVPTVMIRFNDEYHGTSSNPSNYLRTQRYLYHWFNKHSNGTPTASTP